MAKGAGMIHPRLATMLVVITTDYPLAAGEPEAFLAAAVAKSFNRISVDGDCSTNDAVILLANGASGAERDDEAFAGALDEVCADLARQVVADGEGATVVLEIGVTGAATAAEAEAIARRIATSPLVKTAAFGHDPNWGRVLAAAGSAPYGDGFARLETDRLTVAFDGVRRVRRRSTDRHRAGARPAPPAASTSSSGSATARPPISPPTSPTTTCGSTRSTRREPGRPQARRPRGRRAARPRRSPCGLRGYDVIVVHGAGPQITAEMERRGITPSFVDGRRVTTAEVLEVVRESLAEVNAAVCAAIGADAVPLFGDEIGLPAAQVESLGLVGHPAPSAPPEVVAALAAGRIPVVAPLAAEPEAGLAERERRRGSGRARGRSRGRRGSCSSATSRASSWTEP